MTDEVVGLHENDHHLCSSGYPLEAWEDFVCRGRTHSREVEEQIPR